MFDRRQIMRTAWAIYRETYSVVAKSRVRLCFAACLKDAWARARQAARRAAMAPEAVRARIEAIRDEIAMLPYKSLRYDIGSIRRHLEAELSKLTTINP